MDKGTIIRNIICCGTIITAYFFRVFIGGFVAGFISGGAFSIIVFSTIGAAIYRKTIKKIEDRLNHIDNISSEIDADYSNN